MPDSAIRVPTPVARKPWKLADSAFVPRLICGVVILLIWEFAVRALAPAYVAKPTGVVMAIPGVLTDPVFLEATGQTLASVAEGLGVTLILGTVIGVWMGRSLMFDRTIRHYINGFNAIPMIVVLPLFSLWFGYSGYTRFATIIFAAIFAIIMNVADGARSVPREYLEVSRSFRANRVSVLLGVVLPASMLTYWRCPAGAGRALIGAVVAEFFPRSAASATTFFITRAPTTTMKPSSACCCCRRRRRLWTAGERSIQHFMPWYRRGDKS